MKKSQKTIRNAIFALVGCVLAYLTLWPVDIDPVAWTPPPAPALEGPYQPNSLLSTTERIGDGAGVAPEDVAVDAQGRVYGSFEDGRILRFTMGSANAELFAATGGRPAGLRFDANANLLVADCKRGLLRIAPDGQIEQLATEAEGVPFRMTDDLDIAADGTIYFSDASSKFPYERFIFDTLEHRPNGRLLAWDPATRTTRVVAHDLHFANGVAISPDQSYLLVTESNTYSVRRVWLTGPRASEVEIFLDNLPGFPDGILSNGRGLYWLAIAAPRSGFLDATLPYPFLRKVVARLPAFARPGPEKYGFVVGLDETGRVVCTLQDPTGKGYANITNVVEHEGFLYFGSLSEYAIGRFPAPACAP